MTIGGRNHSNTALNGVRHDCAGIHPAALLNAMAAEAASLPMPKQPRTSHLYGGLVWTPLMMGDG